MSNDTALVIIDVQQGIFNFDGYPVHKGDELLDNLSSLIDKAHAAGVPVIYVQHVGGSEQHELHPSKPGHAIHPRIQPKEGDLIVKKNHPDSFQDTDLNSLLEALGVKNLVIGGCETTMCVDTSTRSAYRHGYKVTLIADGHSQPVYGVLTGEQMIAHHNAVLGDWFASVKPTAEIEFAPVAQSAGGAKASTD